MTSLDKKINITPKPKLLSPSSSLISQNRFIPLSRYSSPYSPRPRPTYSALAHIPSMPQNSTPYIRSPSIASSSSNITRYLSDKPEFQDIQNIQHIIIMITKKHGIRLFCYETIITLGSFVLWKNSRIGYNNYKTMFAQESAPPFEYTLQFSFIFRIPWISSFNYKKQEADGASPPLLLRQFNVKWWKQVDEGQADIKAVSKYYNSLIKRSPSISTPRTSITDVDTIERIHTAGSSKEEIQKILNEVRRSPSSNEDIFQDT
uniref:Reverse transcriptase domain, zinc finger, CCHC-type, aspartic peptidase domain protein n=1 Tax=Tanacetum cinerariifolium TaxID=118510 RepID=A0A699HN50_TANCI|nr:reverse transcriptase domain, zinc finger, CCHC-type, aspartic peptidase domain protein [Tanacetum cinerariifolium]